MARVCAFLCSHNYVTPTSYLELINTFRTLLESKRGQSTKLKNRWVWYHSPPCIAANTIVCVSACHLTFHKPAVGVPHSDPAWVTLNMCATWMT